jgi:hypothetical protein
MIDKETELDQGIGAKAIVVPIVLRKRIALLTSI